MLLQGNVFYMVHDIPDETGTAMAYSHLLGRGDCTRQYVGSRERHRGCPWCRSWSAGSVKGIDAVLCKVHLSCLPSSKNGVLVPLLRSCPLGHKFVLYAGNIASHAKFAIFCRSVAAREY